VKSRKTIQIGITLLTLILISAVGVPYVEADAMSRTWGTQMNIQSYLLVGNTDEIDYGHWAYVTQAQGPGEKAIPKDQWETMLAGDFSQLANQLKTQIPGCEPTWIECMWSSVRYDGQLQRYYVTGLTMIAMVKNINAGLTGLEIAVIIMAIAFLMAVLTICLTGSWVTTKVIAATEAIGPWMTILIGVIILIVIGFLAFTLIGGKINYSSKKRSFSSSREKKE
jgi:hypothetical protein